MSLVDFDIVSLGGGTPPSYAVLGQEAIKYYGKLLPTYRHPTLVNGGDFLRLGPNVLNTAATSIYFPKGIPTASDEAVDTAIVFSGDYFITNTQSGSLYLLHRWAGGASDSGIRLGFGGANSLILDVNRVQSGAVNEDTYALRYNTTGLSLTQFHGIRMMTRTVDKDVYISVWAHFNISDLNTFAWTKLFTVWHRYGSSSVLYVPLYTGAPFASFAVGNMNGLTTPCVAGRSGFALGRRSDAGSGYGTLAFIKNFGAYLGNGG